MSPADVTQLKALFVRPGFAEEIDGIEAKTRDFALKVSGKEFASPSAAWKLLHSAEPNLVLSTFYSSKSSSVQGRIKTFLSDSPSARQRIPYTLMAEMRIVPDLPVYAELVDKLFFELMDGKLSTPEEMKAYLEPFSPPAPPPPVNLRRAKARKEARPSRAKGKKAAAVKSTTVAGEEEAVGIAEGIMKEGDLTGPDRGPEPTIVTPISKVAPEPAPVKKPVVKKAPPAAAKPEAAPVKAAPITSKMAPQESAPAKTAPVKVVPAKVAAPAKKATPTKAPPAKAHPVAKKAAPAKASAVKPVAKKVAFKAPAKKAAPMKVAAKKVAPAKKTTPTKAVVKKPIPAKKSAPAKIVGKKAAPAKKAPAKVAKKAVRR